MRTVSFLLLAFLPATALADTFDARVVAITDGDTITVLDASKQLRAQGAGAATSLPILRLA